MRIDQTETLVGSTSTNSGMRSARPTPIRSAASAGVGGRRGLREPVVRYHEDRSVRAVECGHRDAAQHDLPRRREATRSDHEGGGLDFAYAVAVSPNGRRAFVTGFSIVAGSAADYATIGYDTATGAQVWARRYNGAANRDDAGSDLVVSPRGNRVFVTGTSTGATSGQDYATIAYHS